MRGVAGDPAGGVGGSVGGQETQAEEEVCARGRGGTQVWAARASERRGLWVRGSGDPVGGGGGRTAAGAAAGDNGEDGRRRMWPREMEGARRRSVEVEEAEEKVRRSAEDDEGDGRLLGEAGQRRTKP